MRKLTFDKVLKKSIYKDRDALYDLLPKEGLVGRVSERNDLIMELAPILLNSPVASMFVYGTPGTGKTALTLEICNELKRESKKKHIEIKVVYINCSENRTEYSILLEILTRLSNTEVPKLGWSTKKVLTEIRSSLKNNTNVLVVLDEIDYVLKESGDDILYRLSRINNNLTSKLSSIVISNDLRVYDYLSPRTQSSFGRIKIIFSPYTTQELKAILANRAAKAYLPKVVSSAVLGKIADIESERGGDARKALELLDACGKISLARGKKRLTLEVVEEADKNLERDSLIKTLTGLTKHQKILYLTLLKSKAQTTGPEVYLNYVKACKSFKATPLSERRIRTFVIFFNELDLIHSEVGWVTNLKKKSRKISLNLDSAIKIKIRKKVRDSI
ncbi:AAA family ATPase [Candidatus Woesearchaeota archaeon]|nr:AAA family ATPase [Candidatus Woesearchaeota archaeon]MBT3304751.1 AAA family ATPase [Candidatus Woesearchaeota archaeon]MBT4367913.1 AAA family ATPase [Candidatus Woesearchaeota archaeon]MBT4712401.1 AAA family ATPase [Candidatus Woesearchaeota archaeon]MBT6639313.1 AAA family ATPase [Candidatus Woesearchaeota archaeon]